MAVPLWYLSLYPVMGPLWCGQDTFPHIMLIDLFSTDTLVSSRGTPSGAEREETRFDTTK